MAKKTILESLVAKYKKAKKYTTRYDMDIEITPEEREWVEEHKDELYEAFNKAEREKDPKHTYGVDCISIAEDQLQLVIS